MDPDQVFDEFNEIIGPDFAFRYTQTSDSDSIGQLSKAFNDTDSETSSPSDLRKPGKESDSRIPEDERLLSSENLIKNIHGKLFRPKELVYIKRHPGLWTNVAEDECVLVTDIEERTPNDGDAENDNSIHVLRYIRACHNGHHFGVTKQSIEICSSSQEIVNLTAEDLGVIPIRLLPPAKRQDIQTILISRGKNYRMICERSHIPMQYKGQVIPLGQGTDWTWTTDQRVVVDEAAARAMRGAHANIIFTASRPVQGLKAFLGTGHSMPGGGDPLLSQRRELMSDDILPGAKGKHKSSDYAQTGEEHEWTDIDYLTCPPTLVAFLLDENIWANVHVEHLTDIFWPGSPLDSLELEVGKKELIQNLTRRFKTKKVSEGSHQDTGGGQGGNLIIFLSGPPGVGKTLTAEVVAEEAQRPLYRISAGELSLDPSALENQLGDIFLLARRWGAIILIDEAGMFMTKRQASTPDQNAAVTAFLRLLHTYDGLIFLTSTSEDIDTAFYDRIHATIKYTGLDETQRTNIWRRQLQRAVGSPEGHSPNSPWPEEAYRLLGKVETNGREIRNIVRTAEQLTIGLSTGFAMEHVAAAMRNFGGSDNNVGSICEKLEVLEEKAGGHRGLACDDDVGLQH